MNKRSKCVGVLFGGPSSEYEVSCQSALAVIQGLEQAGYEVIPIGVSKEGRWFAPIDKAAVKNFDWKSHEGSEVVMWQRPGQDVYSVKTGEAIARLDVAFSIIHGQYGEDGHLQAFFDMLGLPYVGTDMASSVVGMDKVYMRAIFAAHHLPQVAYMDFSKNQWQRDKLKVIDMIEDALEYPIFVKPANAGSSVGVSKVESTEDLISGIESALTVDSKILCEQGRNVREIEFSVLGNTDLGISSPGEIVSGTSFYDYEAKYASDSSYTVIPADLASERIQELQDMAKKAYQVLGLKGFSRVDFFIDKDTDAIYLNEVNTLPGFTEISMYAKLWAHEGVSLSELVDKLVILAIDRHEQDGFYSKHE